MTRRWPPSQGKYATKKNGSRIFTPADRIAILAQIKTAVDAGATLEAALKDAGILSAYYYKWKAAPNGESGHKNKRKKWAEAKFPRVLRPVVIVPQPSQADETRRLRAQVDALWTLVMSLRGGQ